MTNINEEKNPKNLSMDDLQETDILREEPLKDYPVNTNIDGRRNNGIIALICIIIWAAVCLYSVLTTPAPEDLNLTESIAIEETVVDATEEETVGETTVQETAEETVPEVEEPVVVVNVNKPETDVELLACVIYQEAGADYCCDECRRRVADIVLNRVADPGFPNTIHGVLTQYQQYGRFYWTGVVWPARASNAGEKHAVERAYRIAEEVLNGQHSELYGKGYIWQAEFTQGSEGFWHCKTYYGRG